MTLGILINIARELMLRSQQDISLRENPLYFLFKKHTLKESAEKLLLSVGVRFLGGADGPAHPGVSNEGGVLTEDGQEDDM